MAEAGNISLNHYKYIKDMDNKITPTPWVITDFCLANYTIESGNIRILKTFHDDSDEACKANAEAIVSAVNNTYGKGISPETVPKLVDFLRLIEGWAGNLPDDRLTGATGPNDAAMRGNMVVAMRSFATKALELIK